MDQVGKFNTTPEQSSPESSPINASPTTPLQTPDNHNNHSFPTAAGRSSQRRKFSPLSILIVSRARFIFCLPLSIVGVLFMIAATVYNLRLDVSLPLYTLSVVTGLTISAALFAVVASLVGAYSFWKNSPIFYKPYHILLGLVLILSVSSIGVSCFANQNLEKFLTDKWVSDYQSSLMPATAQLPSGQVINVKDPYSNKSSLAVLENRYSCCGLRNITEFPYPNTGSYKCVTIYKFTEPCYPKIVELYKSLLFADLVSCVILAFIVLVAITLQGIAVYMRL